VSATAPLPPAPRRSTARGRVATFVVACVAATAALHHTVRASVFLPAAARPVAALFPDLASTKAVGRSGELRVRLALPGDTVSYPLAVRDTGAIAYEWVRVGGDAPAAVLRTLDGAPLVAPTSPGFFHLVLVRGEARQVLDDVTLAVLVPFEAKEDGRINGYRIGTYLSERLGARYRTPEGFLEVRPEDLALPLTRHFRVGDFVTRDGQQTWPRYVALEPRLLDKLELVLSKVQDVAGLDSLGDAPLSVRVNAGFRTPAYNKTVPGSAKDSQHQYGDAADVAIDANADGRVDRADTKLVALAVNEVERENPDLAGGLGLYTSRRWSRPFVHIDARGRAARWTR
jgi:uncharacterized protein YcbK (DUF882 family)